MNSMSRREALGLAAVAAVGAAAALQGCTGETEPQPNPPAPESPDQVALKLTTVGGMDPMMEFAANTTAAVTAGSENVCFSPASLYLDLGLLGVGVTGATQAECLRALCVESADDLAADLRQATDDLKLDPLVKDTLLHVASSVWTDKDCPVTKEYAARAQEVADAQAMTVAFGTPDANHAMTKWVSDQTQGLLKPEFQTADPADGDGTALMLLNTVYVKPRWSSPFDPKDNEEGDFAVTKGETVPNVEFMCQNVEQPALVGDGFAVAYKEFEVDVRSLYEEADAVEAEGKQFDYEAADAAAAKCQCKMMFLLPDRDKELADVLGTPDDWAKFLMAECDDRYEVDWRLPKMDFDTDFDLIGTLKSLGMSATFAPSLDFRQMVTPPAASAGEFVGEVRQGTHLTLDETGVEAAAYTSIGVMAMSAMPQDPKKLEFHCDRPFGFALFVGDRALFTGVFRRP